MKPITLFTFLTLTLLTACSPTEGSHPKEKVNINTSAPSTPPVTAPVPDHAPVAEAPHRAEPTNQRLTLEIEQAIQTAQKAAAQAQAALQQANAAAARASAEAQAAKTAQAQAETSAKAVQKATRDITATEQQQKGALTTSNAI